MKIYAPKYYESFKCIADGCTHSCCMGWRISIDPQSAAKYAELGGEYASAIRESIAHDADGAYIPLTECGRCPHLSEKGLCRIIEEYGEDCIAQICREHPRFYNDQGDRIEVGLGASCPEASRIILASQIDDELKPICEDDEEAGAPALEVYKHRGVALEILKACDGYNEVEDRLCEIYRIPRTLFDVGARRMLFDGLEYLHADTRDMITSIGGVKIDDEYSARMLWYFLYRHLCGIEDESEARTIIAFALLSVHAVWSICSEVGEITEALRIYSEEIEYSTDNVEALMLDLSFELI